MKKLMIIFVILSMITCVIPCVIPASAAGSTTYFQHYYSLKIKNGEIDPSKKPEFIIGDPSFDGKINAEDALVALQLAVKGRGYHVYGDFEGIYVQYYYQGDNQEFAKQYAIRDYLECNAGIIGDTDLSYTCNAGDALQILQYAVGKRTEFDRKDYSDTESRRWLVWFDEWYPGMYADLPAHKYEGMAWPPPTPTDAG